MVGGQGGGGDQGGGRDQGVGWAAIYIQVRAGG